MAAITQMTFQFMEWEKVFQTWRDNEPIYDDEMQLVISTHPYSSGYWIEKKGAELTKGDFCYVGEQVHELEKRIRAEIELAQLEERMPRFTI